MLRPTHPKLLGPAKWTYFYLYVILDVFSRYVTGWMVAYRESAELAKRLIEESCNKQHIQPGQLTLHADRGSSMRSKPVALLLADLVSRKRIVGRTSRTTIRTQNFLSEFFSPGITKSSATPAWACCAGDGSLWSI